MTGDHYFTAQPASSAELRSREVTLRGHTLEVVTAGGVFSPQHLDTGTRVLLEHVPQPPAGDLLDLGCGWGPITLAMAMASPDATVWAMDVNERALDLTARNAAAHGLSGVRPVTPDGVPPGVGFAAIWSNPPVRVGKPVLHGMLKGWLARLRPDGEAHLVVARNLGSDSLARWIEESLAMTCERVASEKGFRVLRVRPQTHPGVTAAP